MSLRLLGLAAACALTAAPAHAAPKAAGRNRPRPAGALLPELGGRGGVVHLKPETRNLKPETRNPKPADRIEVNPAEVTLDGRRAYRQLVVTGYFNGEPRDLTHAAVYRTTNPGVVKVAGGRVTAAGDGRTAVTITVAGRTVQAPAVVSNYGKPEPVRFKFETLAALTKQGCASGSCHGSPHGKGGFSLSLFGYDPRIDRVSLTRDGFNRRLNVIEPVESLLLKKPLLEVPHGGGKRLRKNTPPFQTLRNWIDEGASVEMPAVECAKIVLAPGSNRVLRAPHLKQQLSVLAHFTDGSVRDVTSLATYESSHPSVAGVDAEGLVTGSGRGQAAISVRYLDQLESVYLTVVQDVPGFAWSNPPENNVIDRLVHEKLRQLQYLPSETCTDEVFLRRVSLDLTGLLPAPERSRRFLADAAPDKRAKLIDELLATDEFARFWALKKADLMRISPKRLPEGRADRFAAWIVDAFRQNMPYDRFAREILTAAGDTQRDAAANYFLAIPTGEERTEMTAQLFMGSRLECARCHNHPFENWTMRDYYRLTAVFARTVADKGQVKVVDAGETLHPTTGETLAPWGLAAGAAPAPADRRAVFAEWLTKPGNPYFARVEANRIWADLLGQGIVTPVDDFRSSNPPSNAPLLDALAREFEQGGYDRKRLIRLICNSRAYQRSTQTNRFNETDERLFSHARPRLLTAEQLKDAIGLATRTLAASPAPDRVSTYATQRPYPEPSSFTAAFGQPQRETACTCERQTSPTLLQALELLNGGMAHRAAAAGAAHYAPLSNDALVEELYLSALCRLPTERERAAARQYLEKAPSRATGVTDLVWTVVNTQEFLFQH